MILDNCREKEVPFDRQELTKREVVWPPISKLDDESVRRLRATLMRAIESEARLFSHACERLNRDLQPLARDARERRVDQQQQSTVDGLLCAQDRPVETTIGFDHATDVNDFNDVNDAARLHGLHEGDAGGTLRTRINDAERETSAEVTSIEEPLPEPYPSVVEPSQTWLERWLLREAAEVFNYMSCVAAETSPLIRAIWERFLDEELAHLQEVAELFKQFDGRDPQKEMAVRFESALRDEELRWTRRRSRAHARACDGAACDQPRPPRTKR